jgi:nicotinamidase-related amidase
MKKACTTSRIRSVALIISLLTIMILSFLPAAYSQTIVDEWSTVKAPPAPELKAVSVDPKTTALLLLDFNKQTCNVERRPRCIASIPRVKKLLEEARAKRSLVIYSLSSGATTTDIAPELAPAPGDPVVSSGPDKFLGTDLIKILGERKIETVIVTGTAAHGAVLYTASGAALRGMRVILPVDGISAESLYPEQYTVWHLMNAPRISGQVTITKIDLIKY